MKPSVIVFTVFCTGTLLVQLFLNLGYKKGYEEHLLFVKNQHFPINRFPIENIKTVVANGVRFTVYVTQPQQGFKQDVRPEGITFTAKGDTLFITSKDGNYNERNYFATYFRTVPTLILSNANANIIAKEQPELNIQIEKKGQLLVEKSNFNHIKAQVKDSSALIFDEDAVVDLLELTLKDKSKLQDHKAQINRIAPTYISDSASLALSGRVLRALKKP